MLLLASFFFIFRYSFHSYITPWSHPSKPSGAIVSRANCQSPFLSSFGKKPQARHRRFLFNERKKKLTRKSYTWRPQWKITIMTINRWAKSNRWNSKYEIVIWLKDFSFVFYRWYQKREVCLWTWWYYVAFVTYFLPFLSHRVPSISPKFLVLSSHFSGWGLRSIYFFFSHFDRHVEDGTGKHCILYTPGRYHRFFV